MKLEILHGLETGFNCEGLTLRRFAGDATRPYFAKIQGLTGKSHYRVVPICINVERCRSLALFAQYGDIIDRYILSQIPDFESDRGHFVFFQTGDHTQPLDPIRHSVVFMEACNKSTKGIPMFLPCLVGPVGNPPGIGDGRWLASFVGATITSPVRGTIREYMLNQTDMFFKDTHLFHQSLIDDVQLINRLMYRKVMNESKFVACPLGVGPNSYRFFETMKFGRIPILISDMVVLPLEGYIDYSKFSIRLPESKIHNMRDYIEDFLSNHDLNAASLCSRRVYEEYFVDINKFIKLSLKSRIRFF